MTASDLVAIAVPGGFHAEINPLGAELWRLRDGGGRELLWNGDPAFWTGRAPVLFPVIGRLRDDAYRYRGQTYHLAKHGFARRLVWEVVAHRADSATLRLEASAATLADYPFAFALELTFAVAAGTIEMTAELTNAGDDAMPFSFGFHPALRWPFAAGVARGDCGLRFDCEELQDVARLNGEGLIGRREASPVAGRELALRDALFLDDALVFAGLASRGLEFGARHGEQLRIDFPQFPDLGVWTKPGAGYLCIEPWLGTADPADFDGDIFAKPGIATLPAGQVWRGAMAIGLTAQGGAGADSAGAVS